MSNSVVVQNYRSFKDRIEIPLRRINILVGENSSGKSSLLGAIATCMSQNFPHLGQLENSPFEYQSFESLVSDGRDYFVLGSRSQTGETTREQEAEYTNIKNVARMKTLTLTIGDECQIKVTRKQKNKYVLSVKFETKDEVVNKEMQFSLGELIESGEIDVHSMIFHFARRLLPDSFIDSEQYMRLRHMGRETVLLAPIRSKPQRIYHVGTNARNCEGSHVPQLLHEASSSRSKSDVEVIKFLEEFGKDSGLYEKITSRAVRLQGSRSFELIVEKNGSKRTLLDVGYGVSQVLPILYETAVADMNEIILVEQPEVHLHPSVQAALGTLFTKSISIHQILVVETHSDYLVDRIRLHVRRGEISPNDVGIMYLELHEGQTKLHHIELDNKGHFVNPPASFRGFFLKEQIELLDFDE